jgi:hypothetical protein
MESKGERISPFALNFDGRAAWLRRPNFRLRGSATLTN